MKEIIKNFNNYTISDDGVVTNETTGKVLKPQPDKCGYLKVKLSGVSKYIHRLVAEAFLPNPDNKPQVDHIDTDRTNNKVSNLRWVTYSENNNNPLTLKHTSEAAKGKHTRAVIGINIIDGSTIEFNSATEAESQGFIRSSITKCCTGVYKQHKGYKWTYK